MSERVEDLERRIVNDRRQIDQTLEALEQRLSPGQLVDYVMGYMKSGGAELAGNWGRAVKQNPFPLALTAVGLAWLMRSSQANGTADGLPARSPAQPADAAGFHEAERRPATVSSHHPSVLDRARRVAHELKQQVNETAEAFAERVAQAQAEILGLAKDVGETAGEFAGRIAGAIGGAIGAGSESVKAGASHGAERARELAERTRQLAGRSREQASAFLHEQPLLAMAVGVGFGALLGALLPTTAFERRKVGPLGERAREEVKEQAHELGKAARRVAGEAVETAVSGAEEAMQHWQEGNGGTSRSRH